ncbi:P-ATPase superfamily P-type ATPase cadmium transporter [Desmospora sp. 8437]|jgi:copper chaperone CopZ|nr:P-ATPase superfamily P-type ATPase cadmium transporter [Desmospora sp. 8437]
MIKKGSFFFLAVLIGMLVLSGCSATPSASGNSQSTQVTNKGSLTKATLKVNELTCGSCTFTIQSALERVKGVQSVKWDAINGTEGTVTVIYDKNVADKKELKKAVLDLGYGVEKIE